MRIKNVHISNFKNFEGNHKFDLNNNINIFYAENGFGKSSFFDALEWCLTGEINRFNEYDNFKDEDIINYNTNESIHDCSVKIEFSTGSIERYFNVENLMKKGKTQVKVEYINENGNIIKSNGRKYINNLIKGKDCLGINSVNNIKQTHILSQDQITNFINSENPKERYQNVLSIMGIENKILIDNLKDINRKLNERIVDLQSKILECENKENNILQNKKNIDIKLLINKIRNLKLVEIDSDIIISLLEKNEKVDDTYLNKSIKNKLKLQSIRYQEQLSIIKKIDINKYENIQSFKKNNDEIIKKINNLRYDIKTRVLNKENLEEKISEISKKENKLKNLINIKENIKIKLEEIEKIKITKEDINNYNNINKELEIVSYAIKYKPEIDFSKESLLKSISERGKLEKDIKDILKTQENDREIINNIEKKLSETNIKDIAEIIDGLEKVKISLISKGDIDFCPVCGSDIKNINILEKIDKSIEVYKEMAFKLEAISKELILSKESLGQKINLYNNNLKELRKKFNICMDNIEILNNKIKNITSNRLYKEDILNFDIQTLKFYEKNIKNKLEDISNYKKLQKEIEDLKDKNKEYLELIDDEFEGIDDILVKLKNNLSNENNKILEMTELETKLNTIINNNNEILYRLDKDILAEKSNIEIKYLIIELDKKVEYIENKISDIEYIVLTLKDYLFNLDKDVEIKQIIEAKDKYSKNKNLIVEKVEDIKSYINTLNSYSKECIEKYLNNDKSLVKKYYNYLNPMPIKQSLHFNTNNEDEKLLIEIKHNEKSITRLANKTLSSGQLNVLALSIFLAMNEYQKMNNLNIIAIDDPIQNMDDINQFSVCDILGNIQNQLIFSTHDIEFLKLFLKKNSFKKGDITIFNIESPYLTPDKVKIIDNA